MTKLLTIYFDGGVFSQIFDAPRRQNYGGEPKKFFDLKWWHGPPLSPCKISWKLRDALGRERTKCDVFFVYNSPEITVTSDLVALLQQEIALVFLGRCRCGLQRFFGEEYPFPVKWTDLEIAARWRYDTWRNARENCQNQRKWVQSLCAPLRPSRSDLKENFYHCLIPHIL